MSMCRVFSCVVGRGCFLWPVCSLGQTILAFAPTSFCTPRPHLPVTPGVSWLLTFALQSPIMKRTSFWGVSSRNLVDLHRIVQVQLYHHYWSGRRLGLLSSHHCLWYWIVCLGNEWRSFCCFWDCIQVLHFRLFCWLWWLLHFFYGILACSSRYNGHLS